MAQGQRLARVVGVRGRPDGGEIGIGGRARRAAAALGLLAAMLLACAPAASARAARSRDKVLSNETTHTTFAEANDAEPIRTAPNLHAHVITMLRFGTPDGFVQTYVLLRKRQIGNRTWILLRIPMRPNGRVGWVPLAALTSFQYSNMEIVVNRPTRQLTVFRGGRVIYRAPVGVGTPSTPTPGGHFWITESFSSNDPFYGPWAFGTSDYSVLSEWPGGGIVGLHGTNQPGLIPGDPSHGCIRLRNPDVMALSHLVSIGTPLWVQ